MGQSESQGALGQIIGGRYRLTRVLGKGGMGRVYQADNTALGTVVAIKILGREAAGDFATVERFIREARAAASVGHPGIVRIIDIGQTEERVPFIVMELLEGRSLAELVERSGRLPWADVAEIGFRVLSALVATHQKGIIHRDLKPENIFVTVQADGSRQVKILDFGISMVGSIDGSLRLTHTGTVLGTPYYMSPEQARGAKDLDHRIDLWSLGVVLYEASTGELPYDGESYNELLVNIVNEPYQPPRTHTPEIPADLEAVILRAMAKDRDKRYQTALEFMDDLQPVFERLRSGRRSVPAAAPAPSKSPTLPATAAAATGSKAAAAAQAAPRKAERGRLLGLFAAGVCLVLVAGAVAGWGFEASRSSRRASRGPGEPREATLAVPLQDEDVEVLDGGLASDAPTHPATGDAGGVLDEPASIDGAAGHSSDAEARAAAGAPPARVGAAKTRPVRIPPSPQLEADAGRDLVPAEKADVAAPATAQPDAGLARMPTKPPTVTPRRPRDEDEEPPVRQRGETGGPASFRPRQPQLVPYPFGDGGTRR